MISIQDNNSAELEERNVNPLKTLQQQSNIAQRAFSPVLGNTLIIKEDFNSFTRTGESVYDQKHNMIIASPGDNTVRFYDANTLLPLEGRDILELDGLISEISFCAENENYIITCSNKIVYLYNFANKSLKKLQNQTGESFFSIIFLDSGRYAFLTLSHEIYISGLENEVAFDFLSIEEASFPFQTLKKGNLLVSGRTDGSSAVYRTDRIPKLPIVCSVKANQIGRFILKLESALIKNKEFLITCGFDGKIHIWHLVKGRMRRLRSIHIGEITHGLVFLEEYKMIAITYGREANEMKFISLLSGREKFTLDLQMTRGINLFLMEDKNAIGVANQQAQIIKIVKLGKDS